MIGRIISHYKVIEKLGGGGMGVVYKAHDIKLGRFVALKFLPPELTRDEESKKRFIHEAKAASALEHANICNIHEIDETDDGQIFIVMSCYEGETLKKKIESGPLKIEEAVNIAIQTAEGLCKAHEKEIIHRDIKPANIFITKDGIVKILDFGLAKVTGQTQLTQMGSTIGTVAYMSPEQARGENVDYRTDIWSLGIVLYEMITGQLPFKGEYDQAVIYSILNEGVEPIGNLRADISDELEIIIGKALEKNPNDRYKDSSDLNNDLIHLKRGKESVDKKKPAKKIILYIASLSLLSFFVLFIIFDTSTAFPFNERDWILIADFENLTEDKVFDKSLYTAFSLSIDQSTYVNLFPRRRMLESLKRMERTEQSFIDEETVREMAIREGINIYVVPSISKVGNKYVLTGKIQETHSGDILISEIQYANNQDEVLEKLDVLSENIRKDLGESRFSLFKKSKSLNEVTTSSLKALQQFALGIEEHWNSNFEQAKNYYENALRIDSNFISAKASLGNILFERYDRERGKELLAEAVKSVDYISDKEKYSILAFYAVNVENDLEKGIIYTKMRIDMYPDDPTPHNNLGWYYQNSGRFIEAINEYKIALKINPHLMLTYSGLIWVYLEFLGQLDSALVWSKRALSYDDEYPWSYFYLGSVYVGKDSLARAEWAYQKALDINPKFILNIYRLAHVYRIQDRYQEAIYLLEKILEINKLEVSAHYDLGINYQFMGDFKSSKKHFEEYRKAAEQWVQKNPENAEFLICLGSILTRLGDRQGGWEIGHKAIELDSTLHFRLAEFMAIQGRTEEALNQLEKAFKKGYRNFAWLKLNPDLQILHNEIKYKKLINQFEK